MCRASAHRPRSEQLCTEPLPDTAVSGVGTAYSLMVIDDNWKGDKFQIAAGSNNFTLDYLNAGETHNHQCAPAPRGPLLPCACCGRVSCAVDPEPSRACLLSCAGSPSLL